MERPWRVELLGGVRALQGEQVVDRFRTRKTALLLAYLAYFLFMDTYRWDAAARKVELVARKGMPATQGLTFENGGYIKPALNNRGEIALVAEVLDSKGKREAGTFFLRPNGELLPVALPDQVLPDGSTLAAALLANINDAGVVAFLGRLKGDTVFAEGAYLWEAGQIRAVAPVGSKLPNGRAVVGTFPVLVNNKNRNVFLGARGQDGNLGSYLFADGNLTPVATRDQEMPGGGKLASLDQDMVSFANEEGEHVFFARLEGGVTAVYRMKADGTLALVVKSGTKTEQGTITRVLDSASAPGLGLNSKGQVALTVRIDGGPSTLVLMTPTTSQP
jgi:hypothetical protein